jgi:hypothetical protein
MDNKWEGQGRPGRVLHGGEPVPIAGATGWVKEGRKEHMHLWGQARDTEESGLMSCLSGN